MDAAHHLTGLVHDQVQRTVVGEQGVDEVLTVHSRGQPPGSTHPRGDRADRRAGPGRCGDGGDGIGVQPAHPALRIGDEKICWIRCDLRAVGRAGPEGPESGERQVPPDQGHRPHQVGEVELQGAGLGASASQRLPGTPPQHARQDHGPQQHDQREGRCPAQQARQGRGDDEDGDHAADPGGDGGGEQLPTRQDQAQDRLEGPTAVHRQSGQQVEDPERHVHRGQQVEHLGEVGEGPGHVLTADEGPDPEHGQTPEQEVDGGAGQGHQEGERAAVAAAAVARVTTEQGQGDVLHLGTAGPCDQSVSHLVQGDREDQSECHTQCEQGTGQGAAVREGRPDEHGDQEDRHQGAGVHLEGRQAGKADGANVHRVSGEGWWSRPGSTFRGMAGTLHGGAGRERTARRSALRPGLLDWRDDAYRDLCIQRLERRG
jgi:hypothetical protein